MWKDFPELLGLSSLMDFIAKCPDMAAEDVVKAVKIFCQAWLDDTTSKYDINLLLGPLILVYDAEAKKGIEDKELFAILYKVRFSKNRESVRESMSAIYERRELTAPKLKSLCESSNLANMNRLRLKRYTK